MDKAHNVCNGVKMKTSTKTRMAPSIARSPIELEKARADYAEGKTTQIPMSIVVSTGKKRVSRKLRLV